MTYARARTMAVARVVVGHGALMRPGRAAVGVAAVLALAALVWLAVSRPWSPSAPAAPPPPQATVAQINDLLSRSGVGPGGSEVRALWGTPEYFRATGQTAAAAEYSPERNHIFLLWENLHDADLPPAIQPVLKVDGVPYEPVRAIVPADAAHHRLSVFLFPRADSRGEPVMAQQSRSVGIVLPPARRGAEPTELSWSLPIQYPEGIAQQRFKVTWGALFALLGGVLASMWPCLFQLTAYFIPSLAGLSMKQAKEREQPAIVKARVLKTAAFFVLGFVIVYTAAGAAAGFAAKSLGGTTIFWGWRQYIAIGAGIILLVMAIRLAANARAPLVCKMPLGSFLGKNPGPLGTMLLGIAFAAGCTTCFGAALVLGLFTYIGIAGSAFSGALVMAAFSLGMAIPLLLGAAAMARVISMLTRLEKVAPYIILASAGVMAVFAVLLLSGRSMVLSNWVLHNLS